MLLQDFIADIKAETVTKVALRRIKWLKQVPLCLFAHSTTVIDYGDSCLVSGSFSTEPDTTTDRARIKRVGNQIHQHLCEFVQ